MRSAVRVLALLVVALSACAEIKAQLPGNGAQSAPGTTAAQKPRPAFRRECVLPVGFCVAVPSAWRRMGNVFDDLGFVAAEPHAGSEPAAWPQLTVVAFEPPPQTAGSSGTAGSASQEDSLSATQAASTQPSLDDLVERMLAPSGALGSAQTVARSRVMLNGAPAQIVRVQFHDDAGKTNATEQVALIDGADGLVYSVALRCAPEDFERLDPVFQRAINSWRIQPTASEPAAKKAAPGAGKQPANSPASAQKQGSAKP